MPLLKEINQAEFNLALWHTQEAAEYFLGNMPAEIIDSYLLQISNHQKQLEFLSSRYLVQHILGNTALQYLKKQANGKPFFENDKKSVSISHSSTHAAVLISESANCGVDVETIHPRVNKIASRFLSEEERNLANGDIDTELFTLFWSAKETVFKWYAEGNLSFSQQILLQPNFVLAEKGQLHYKLLLPEVTHDIMVYYERIGGQMLTYAL